jgi:U3 small nucleolar RNA-associated protein 15
MLVTAGGTYLCCWDLYSGGRLLHKFAAHQKTVTSVLVQRAVSTPSSDGSLRILSSSLDGHVKVFDPEVFKLTHASKYPSPILSLALAPDNSSFAVGMADGTLSMRRRRQERLLQESARAPASQKR